jgi:hypothetical protein
MNLTNVAVMSASLVIGVGAAATIFDAATNPRPDSSSVQRPVSLKDDRRGSERGAPRFAPCEKPARLIDGVCVTDVTRTVVSPQPGAPPAGPAPQAAPAPAAPQPQPVGRQRDDHYDDHDDYDDDHDEYDDTDDDDPDDDRDDDDRDDDDRDDDDRDDDDDDDRDDDDDDDDDRDDD